MQPSLRHWRAFQAVHQAGSMTIAARGLNLTQSAVSLLIRDLESAIDVSLFERSHRSIRATAVADDLIPGVEHMLRTVDQFHVMVQQKSVDRNAQLSVAVVPSIGSSLMPGILATFAQHYPNVAVAVHERWSQEAAQLVVNRRVDFAIGTFDPTPEIELEMLVPFSLMVLCRPDSPLAARERITWADVYEQPVIALIQAGVLPTWIGDTLAGEREPFKPAFKVSKIISAIAMVHQNLGCTIVPSYLANDASANGLLALRVDEPINRKQLAVIVSNGTTLSPAARLLANLVREEVNARVEQVTPALDQRGFG